MSANRIFKKGVAALALGITTYSLPLAVLHCKSLAFSERIRDQSHLNEVIDEERRRLGIGSEIIGEIYHNPPLEAMTWKYLESKDNNNKGNVYAIGLHEFLANRDVVRHELYHIKKGNIERKYNGINLPFLGFHPTDFRYWLKDEPRAVLYQSTGLRL